MTSDVASLAKPVSKFKRKSTEDRAFLHDANASNDIKLIKLRRLGGWSAYGLYWVLLEQMRLQKDLSLTLEGVDDLAWQFQVDSVDLTKIIEICITCKLFVVDGDRFYSPSLIRRIAAYENKHEKTVEAGRKGGLVAQAQRKAKAGVLQSPEIPASSTISDVLKQVCVSASSKPNIIQSNIIESNKIESNGRASDPPPKPPPPEIPPDLSEFWNDAVTALVDENHESLTQSGVYASTGRRPMRKYPELWISPIELAEVFKLFHDSGIPPDKFGLAFKPVVARLRTHKANGSRTDNVAAVNWLSSWALDGALTTLKKAKDLERSEKYLEQSQRSS